MNNSARKPNALPGWADVKSMKIEELEPHLSVCEDKLNWAINQVLFLRQRLYELKKLLARAKKNNRAAVKYSLQIDFLNTNGMKCMYDNYVHVIERRIEEIQNRIFESKYGPSISTSGPLTSFGPSTTGSSTSCGPSSSGPSTSFGLVSRPSTSCTHPSTSASCSRPSTPSSGPSASFYPSTPSSDPPIPFYNYIPSPDPLPSSYSSIPYSGPSDSFHPSVSSSASFYPSISFGPSSSSDATTFFDSSIFEDSAFVLPSEIDERK